jgi:hypothetical protein
MEPQSDGQPPEGPTGEPARAETPLPKEPETAEAPERARLERYNEVLLTASSILAGFAMTGLLGLPEAGREGLERLAASLFYEPFVLTFPIVFYAMLVATVCFLGVMVTIVSGRLQGRRRRLPALRSTYRASVLVFGVGLSALFCATVTIGVPTYAGFLIGLGGGAAITLVLFVRALRLQ